MSDIRKLLETLEAIDPKLLKENLPEVSYEDIRELFRTVNSLESRVEYIETKLGMNM